MRESFYSFSTRGIAALVLCCVIGSIATRTHGVDLQTVWSTNYPIGRAASMALDAAGNMYVTGGYPQPGTLTLKIDPQGQILWQAPYQSITNLDTPVQLLLDAETNVYVLGYSWTENGTTDSFLLKYSRDGVPLWQRSRGAPYTYYYGYTYLTGLGQMVWQPSGHLVVTSTALGTNGYPVIRTTKYTLDGQELWTAENEGADPMHVNKAISLEPNDGVSVTALSSNVALRLYYDANGNLLSNIVYRFRATFGPFVWQPAAAGNLLTIGNDACRGWGISRIGSDGNEQWFRHYGGKNPDGGQYDPAWTTDRNGCFYVAGSTCNGHCIEATGFHTFLLKYDAAGNRVWGNSFPADLMDHARSIAIKLDAEGNVYLGTMFYLIKYDAKGNRLWATRTGTDRLANFELGSNGDIYLAGSKSGPGFSQYFLLARFRQPSTTNLARLEVPLTSQAHPIGGTMSLSAVVSAPEPVRYRWRNWGNLNYVASRATNATYTQSLFFPGEYNVEMITSAGSTFSPWAKVNYQPMITNVTRLPDGKISFAIVTYENRNPHLLEGSSDLSQWHVITNLYFCGNAPVATATINPDRARFFRVTREN